MLFTIDREPVTTIPKSRQADYHRWCAALAAIDPHRLDQVKAAINAYIDGKDYFRASFIPGSDWTGTIFEPLYDACNQSWDNSRWFFGLIAWEAVTERDDDWAFLQPELGDPLISKEYCRIQIP